MKHTPHAKPLTAHEKLKKRRAIQTHFDAQRKSLGLEAPSFSRGPVFYLALLGVMLFLGVCVLSQNDRASQKRADGRILKAQEKLNVIAEAMGRFRFHVGRYPFVDEGHLTEQRVATWQEAQRDQQRASPSQKWREADDTNVVDGIEVLAEKPFVYAPPPGWNGPYVTRRYVMQRISIDPWGQRLIYEPNPTNALATPLILSCGPDGVRGTSDDLVPHPECFLRPFEDVSWTNNWVSYDQRGLLVVPSQKLPKQSPAK